MTSEEFNRDYWDYYIHLESKFMATRNFVSFSTDNFGTYSNEFVSQIQSIGSEIDVVLKALCGYPGDKSKGMNNYKEDLPQRYKTISSEGVRVAFFNIDIIPFEDIAKGMSWWQNYNSIKHDRITSKKKGNLETTMSSLAALFLLNRLQLHEMNEIDYLFMQRSQIFKPLGWNEYKPRMIASNPEGYPVEVIESE